jgi:hypothetical protein
MKRLISALNSWVHKIVIECLLPLHCGKSVSTSGKTPIKKNCFWIGYSIDSNTYMGMEREHQGNFICSQYLNDEFFAEVTVSAKELTKYDIEFRHYSKFYRIEITGIYKFILTFIFWKIYANCSYYLGDFSQLLFNRRSLNSKKRYEFLKHLIDNFIGKNEGFSYVDVMSTMHSIKVFLHPDFNSQAAKVHALLDGLVETHELKLSNGNYFLTGLAFKSLDEYEVENRRHRAISATQWVLILLTVGLLVATLIQADKIKIPTLIDLT